MQKTIHILISVGLIAALLVIPSSMAIGEVGPAALNLCRDFAFSVEEDFVTHGPEPPDGNPIISDGDMLGLNCTVCARVHDPFLKSGLDVDARVY